MTGRVGGGKAELITLLHTINNLMLCQKAYGTEQNIEHFQFYIIKYLQYL